METEILSSAALRELDAGYSDYEGQQSARRVHGWFYYRYESGESPADCCDKRLPNLIDSLARQAERKGKTRAILVSHESTMDGAPDPLQAIRRSQITHHCTAKERSTMSAKNYYDILEVSHRARTAVVNAAWKALSREYPEGATERYLLNEAHEVLDDPDKRKTFDESLNPYKGRAIRIGPYRILDQIAEGGFGVTYRAVHEFLGELVCIKHSLNISPIDEALMLEEAKSVWDLRHWAIPSMRDVVKLEDGSIALVMSYVPGPNLQQMIQKNGPMDPEHVCWIVERVLNALHYLHDHGVIHGDVKPANVIIAPDTHQVCLVDYGLALVKPGKDSTNKGYTPMFASPEQRDNKPLLPESDLYSLGLTMIFALGGDPGTAKVPVGVPDAICEFIKKLIVHHILSRPNWQKEDLCRTMSDVRLQAFGRRASNMKPLKV